MTDNYRSQLVFDIFTTALEGGIGYWSECTGYNAFHDGQENLLGFYADIIELDSGDVMTGPAHIINCIVISRGLRLGALNFRDEISWQCDGPPPLVVTEDGWDFDASDADVIVQLGLFGEVRYG